jgi:hypothetical protein
MTWVLIVIGVLALAAGSLLAGRRARRLGAGESGRRFVADRPGPGFANRQERLEERRQERAARRSDHDEEQRRAERGVQDDGN